MAVGARTETLSPHLSCFRDTCNVYVLRSGREAIAIDFGDGDVLDHLDELGIDRLTDVLVTHHHRDQVGGLARAVAAGIRVWVPPLEVGLIARVDEHWRRRKTLNDYDLREDRFSLLEPVPVDGVVAEYRTRRYGGLDVYTLPTPGHTPGSVAYLVELDGRLVAFTGDLLHGDGKVWSLAATQWSYSGTDGQAATVVSCAVLAGRGPDVVLPSHGEPIDEPAAALALVGSRLQELLNMRRHDRWDIDALVRAPWTPVTPHLLRNRASFANSFALVSASGAALLLDFGYDLMTGLVPTTAFEARRALLWPLEALRRDHGVDRIETVAITHYHDDHVAGVNLLRDVEGVEVWAAENVAPILEEPSRYDLPCLWWEPVPVDRRLPLGTPVRWHEYELTAYPLPGHTLFASAILFEVDGRRVLAIGDQQSNDAAGPILNYQYRNRFRPGDYVRSAELYRELRPDVLVNGHWAPQEVTDELLDRLLADGRRLEELHAELLPEEGFGARGFGARIEPYRATVRPGEALTLEVTVQNPFDREAPALVRLVLPEGWAATPAEHQLDLGARGEAVVAFEVTVGAAGGRVGADLTVGGTRFGQQAEALVEVA